MINYKITYTYGGTDYTDVDELLEKLNKDFCFLVSNGLDSTDVDRAQDIVDYFCMQLCLSADGGEQHHEICNVLYGVINDEFAITEKNKNKLANHLANHIHDVIQFIKDYELATELKGMVESQ